MILSCAESKAHSLRAALPAHRAEMGFGVSADIGEPGGIADLGGLAGVGVGPALALFEFHGMVVEQFVNGDRGEYEDAAYR